MINFFRKIRRKLAEDNKPKKYLRYAFGEILLVVIGILIALQLNNWNHNRIQKKNQKQLLLELTNEMGLNVERINYINANVVDFKGDTTGISQMIQFSDSIYKIIKRGISKDDIEYLVSKTLFSPVSLNLHTSLFEEMKNTGHLYLIGSDTLANEIQKYYKNIDKEENYAILRNQEVLNQRDDCKYGWINFRSDYEINSKESIQNHLWLFDKESKNFIDFKLFIEGALFALKTNQTRMLEIVTESEKLRKFILLEQKKRN